MVPLLNYSILPPWKEDGLAADRLWRLVVGTLGRECDELWLRFGNLDGLQRLLLPEQYRRLEEWIGPHWGKPDPQAAGIPPVQSAMGELLPEIVKDFKRMGFGIGPAPRRQQPKYAPYGCAVVPLTNGLLNLLTSLAPSTPVSVGDVLSLLADHWHFRCAGRNVISTGDGMAVMGLTLISSQVEPLRQALSGAGLDPDLLVEQPPLPNRDY